MSGAQPISARRSESCLLWLERPRRRPIKPEAERAAPAETASSPRASSASLSSPPLRTVPGRARPQVPSIEATLISSAQLLLPCLLLLPAYPESGNAPTRAELPSRVRSPELSRPKLRGKWGAFWGCTGIFGLADVKFGLDCRTEPNRTEPNRAGSGWTCPSLVWGLGEEQGPSRAGTARARKSAPARWRLRAGGGARRLAGRGVVQASRRRRARSSLACAGGCGWGRGAPGAV